MSIGAQRTTEGGASSSTGSPHLSPAHGAHSPNSPTQAEGGYAGAGSAFRLSRGLLQAGFANITGSAIARPASLGSATRPRPATPPTGHGGAAPSHSKEPRRFARRGSEGLMRGFTADLGNAFFGERQIGSSSFDSSPAGPEIPAAASGTQKPHASKFSSSWRRPASLPSSGLTAEVAGSSSHDAASPTNKPATRPSSKNSSAAGSASGAPPRLPVGISSAAGRPAGTPPLLPANGSAAAGGSVDSGGVTSASHEADHGGGGNSTAAGRNSTADASTDADEKPGAAAGGGRGGGTRQSRMRGRICKELVVNTKLVATKNVARSLFVKLSDSTKISDFYTFGEEILGGGGLSKVMHATSKKDGKDVVVKIRRKGHDPSAERAWRQVMMQLRGMNKNNHVLDLVEILEDDTQYFIVMPKCDGGELYEFLVTAEEVPERECRRIIREVLNAVAHLHENDLIHRDIKPENILFDTNRADAASPKTLKLIDFDTVMDYVPNSPKTKKFVGTPGYIAPEVLLGEATKESDLWSVGVILYILMTGDSPWANTASLHDGTVGSPKAIKAYDDLKAEVLDWDCDPWSSFPLARDLCKQLTSFNAKDRGSVQDALNHPWLKEDA